jgi:hypothetical protein
MKTKAEIVLDWLPRYTGRPIDQFGNPTPTWDAMRSVNLQLEKLAPTILKLHSDRVYHFTPVPSGCNGPDASTLITDVAGQPLAVGDFTHDDGSRWVMIMNRDTERSHPCLPTFRNSPARLRVLSAYIGELLDFEGEHRWLAPGQGVLLKLD